MTIEFDELTVTDDRGGEPRGRRRIVAGVAAAMLIAAAGGAGYGIGRSADDDTDGQSALDEGPTDGSSAAPATTLAQPSVDDTPRSTISMIDEASGDSADTDLGQEIRASGGTGYAALGSQPSALLAERVTDTGFTLRVALGQTWDNDAGQEWGAGDWRPAPWCYESGQLRVALTGNGVIDLGAVGWYSEPFKGRSVSSILLGASDGSPQWVVVVQTPVDVANVRVVFADGFADETAPENGIAVLTAPGQAPTPVDEGDYTYWMDPTPSFEVTFEGADEPVTLGSDGVGTWEDPEFRESCSPPPPPLPDAGEQPADPAAADAEIRAAMSALYGIIGTGDVGSDLIDDPTGVAEAREQVQAGGFADDAASATATIAELVFTAPTEAWFRYSIDTDGNDFDNRYGIAVLVDGVWKVTRSTVCQDLSLAGGDCGPGWQQIYPPGAYPDGGGLDDGHLMPATTVLIDD